MKRTPAPRKKAAPAKRTPSTTERKLVEKRKKLKKVRLSVEEKRLLLYPPTQTTWRCKCDMVNSGTQSKCWICRTPKSKKLLWPIYTAACTKVGIEPGDQWKIVDPIRGIAKSKRGGSTRWNVIEPPEGFTF